jgi:hypothetical protein
VPGGLRHGRKTGIFLPHLRDTAAGYGGFIGITRRAGAFWRETGQNRRKNAPVYPASGTGVCPRRESDVAAYRAPGVGVCPRREPDAPVYRTFENKSGNSENIIDICDCIISNTVVFPQLFLPVMRLICLKLGYLT